MKLWFPARHGAASIRRFVMSFVFSILLFLLLMYYLFFLDDVHDNTYYIFYFTSSVAATVVFSAAWQLFWEGRHVAAGIGTCGKYLPAPVVCALLFGLFCYIQDAVYVKMYAAGLTAAAAAAMAGIAVCRDGGRDRIFNKMVCSFVLCSALAFVVFLLLSLCVMAFQFLFAFDQSYYKVYVLFFYFSSIVVGWNALLACVPQGRETVAPSAALQRLVAYIVLPINGLYTVILYGYIAMIAWQGTMPVGKMNWFASIAVLIYVFCFLTCHDYERPPYLKAYVRWGGVLLVPIVAVQLVGVYIRYDAYGLTTLRYVSMACTAFGIIVIAADIFRCSGAWLHFLLAAIAVALTLTPLNVVDLPIRNQEGRMMELLERHGMIDGTTVRSGDISPEDREKLYSAYSYLRGCNRSHIDGAYAPLLDSPAWREIRPKTSFAFYSFLNEDKLVDLTGYGTMYEVDADTDTAFITIRGRTGEITVPIGEYAEHLCRIYGDTQRTHSVPNMNLQLDGGRYLHIRSLQVQRQNGQISHINVMGCLLEK